MKIESTNPLAISGSQFPEFLKDFSEKMQVPGKHIQVVTSLKGASGFDGPSRIASDLTEIELENFHRRKENFAFLSCVEPTAMSNSTRRANKKDVLEKNFVIFDCDFKDPELEGKEFLQTPPWEKRATVSGVFFEFLSSLQEEGFDPYLGVFSGNGFHLYFYLPELLPVSDTYGDTYEAIATRFEEISDKSVKFDRQCKSPTQSFRIPGSMNLKEGWSEIPTEVFYFNEKPNTQSFSSLWKSTEHELSRLKKSGLRSTDLDNLKSALTLEKILAYEEFKYAKAETIGTENSDGEIRCSSPLTSDQNPSFCFNNKSKVWMCNSSGNKGDAFDLIADLSDLDRKKDFKEVIRKASTIAGIAIKNANTMDYEALCRLASEKLKRFRVDILSGTMKWFDTVDKRWTAALDEKTFNILKSHIADLGLKGKSDVQAHLTRLEHEMRQNPGPELLVDIPIWDGRDRIKEIADRVHPLNCLPGDVEQFLKQWLGKVFRRVDDPTVDNHLIILKGPQGTGKDVTIRALTQGLGEFVAPFVFQSQEKDVLDAMHSGIITHISEFDQTNASQISFLKMLITTPRTLFRKAYGKSQQSRKARWSLIASANIDSLLRDPTGNRRFVILDIDRIDGIRTTEGQPDYYPSGLVNYPFEESLQILAQAKVLASQKYSVSPETSSRMTQYIESMTPPDPNEELMADFLEAVERKIRLTDLKPISGYYRIPNSELDDIWIDLGRRHDKKVTTIKAIIQRRKVRPGKINNKTRCWEIPEELLES